MLSVDLFDRFHTFMLARHGIPFISNFIPWCLSMNLYIKNMINLSRELQDLLLNNTLTNLTLNEITTLYTKFSVKLTHKHN